MPVPFTISDPCECCGGSSGSGSGSGVAACGCPAVPRKLVATLSCTDCACGDGTQVDLEWQGQGGVGQQGHWKGTGTFCGHSIEINLFCQPGAEVEQWKVVITLGGDCAETFEILVAEDSCDPFQLTVAIDPSNAAGCCAEPFPNCTVVITE